MSEDRMAKRIAERALRGEQSGRAKTAGEVRFVTDRPGDDERQIDDVTDFEYDTSQLKKLSKVLWSLSCSLGHLISAHSDFTKMKAVRISPDGKLGGQGYIKPISEMRSEMTDCIEMMSAIVDTIDDEVRAPHWKDDGSLTDNEREEVEETIEDAEEIRESPEEFNEEEYEEEVLEEDEGTDE